MSLTVLDNIPMKIKRSDLLKKLHLQENDPQAGEAYSLLEQALSLGRPRACFRLVEVERTGEDFAVLAGEKLSSRIVRVNLEQREVPAVAVFVATCGRELERWAEQVEDFLQRFFADEICELALRYAGDVMGNQIAGALGADSQKISNMNPGSLDDWPLAQQGPLFRIVGDVKKNIGVELTGSFLMRPRKSISGIKFVSTREFISCELCPRETCQGRRAMFDKHLYRTTYPGARQGNEQPGRCAECMEEG
jgi:hypothetical protein